MKSLNDLSNEVYIVRSDETDIFAFAFTDVNAMCVWEKKPDWLHERLRRVTRHELLSMLIAFDITVLLIELSMNQFDGLDSGSNLIAFESVGSVDLSDVGTYVDNFIELISKVEPSMDYTMQAAIRNSLIEIKPKNPHHALQLLQECATIPGYVVSKKLEVEANDQFSQIGQELSFLEANPPQVPCPECGGNNFSHQIALNKTVIRWTCTACEKCHLIFVSK